MAVGSITVCKFVGTISLGLLTGASYTLSSLALPSLLTLPTAITAHHTFLELHALSKVHLRILSSISVATLSLAYILSPSRARHPYLLYTALLAATGTGLDYTLKPEEDLIRRQSENDEVNGEVVRKSVETFKLAESIRAGLSGLAFALGVIGLWGDGA